MAGKRCLLSNEIEPDKWICLVSPGTVNYCFAAELFLKSLLALRQTPKDGHDLHKLLKALPLADQTAARAVYARLYPGWITLEEDLERIKDHFIEVRYWYENTLRGIFSDSAFRCADALYNYCATVHGQQMIADEFPSLDIPETTESTRYKILGKIFGKFRKK